MMLFQWKMQGPPAWPLLIWGGYPASHSFPIIEFLEARIISNYQMKLHGPGRKYVSALLLLLSNGVVHKFRGLFGCSVHLFLSNSKVETEGGRMWTVGS